MKISEIETLLIEEFPNITFVRIFTDEGLVGLGETFWGAQAVAAWIHETAAPYLLGKDPLQIERHWRALTGFVGFNGTGAEVRGKSAVDLALWDILGKECGQPLYRLLGGANRDSIRVYNTCAGYQYVRKRPKVAGLPVNNWGVPSDKVREGPYEDLEAFMHRADELALSLLDEGISGMKIWPFDPFAEYSGGHYLSNEDLKEGLEPFRKIREAVGDKMDIMVELHSLWDLPNALKIAAALEEYEPYWYEDPLQMNDMKALAHFSEATRVPTAAGETLGTRWSYRELLEERAAGVVIVDPAWAGGVTECKKIATMAEAFQVPISVHDCVGPVQFSAAVHLTINATNAFVQESVRAFHTGWYRDLVTELPRIQRGHITPLQGPGLGTELLPEVYKRTDLFRRFTRLQDM